MFVWRRSKSLKFQKFPRLNNIFCCTQSSEARIRAREQKALHTIRNHNFLKTNSHEVRRTVDNMVDRLEYEGLKDFALAVQAMSCRIFDHPDWVGQYEMDAQYAMVDFLFAMTHRPIQNIRSNREEMHHYLLKLNAAMDAAVDRKDSKSSIDTVNPNSSEEDIDWAALLSEDFIPVSSSQWSLNDDNDSSLSVCGLLSKSFEFNLIYSVLLQCKGMVRHE